MTQLKVALEWFLNPDHLPIIAGIETEKYKDNGIDIVLIEPDDHYDGFKYLKEQDIDIHCNEPLHLFEHYFHGLKSIGTFFETRGGVMIRQSSIDKLKSNKKIKISTPAANDTTNKIGFEILKRYAKKERFELDFQNVEFVQTDFWHLKNLKNDETLDGAWLCFYNFEGIEAEFENFENLFIDQFISDYPNFSALDFITTDEIIKNKKDAILNFIKVTNEMIYYCQNNVEDAKNIFYKYTKDSRNDLMDKIIEDTIPRFKNNIKSDSKKYLDLYKFLNQLEIVELSNEEYDRIW